MIELKKGDILVPNSKYKSSLYFNITKVKEVKIIDIPNSCGNMTIKILKGKITRNHYYANGDNNGARVNIRAFKLKESNTSYSIY